MISPLDVVRSKSRYIDKVTDGRSVGSTNGKSDEGTEKWRLFLFLIDGCIDSIKLIEHFHCWRARNSDSSEYHEIEAEHTLTFSSCCCRLFCSAPDKCHHHHLERLMSNWQRWRWRCLFDWFTEFLEGPPLVVLLVHCATKGITIKLKAPSISVFLFEVQFRRQPSTSALGPLMIIGYWVLELQWLLGIVSRCSATIIGRCGLLPPLFV